MSRFLLWINGLLIKISKSIFSYQIFMVVRPLPSVEWLLQRAIESGYERAAASQPAVRTADDPGNATGAAD